MVPPPCEFPRSPTSCLHLRFLTAAPSAPNSTYFGNNPAVGISLVSVRCIVVWPTTKSITKPVCLPADTCINKVQQGDSNGVAPRNPRKKKLTPIARSPGQLCDCFSCKDFAEFRGKSCQRERLLQQHRIHVQYSVMHYGLVRISGHIRNVDLGTKAFHPLRQFAPADAGHPYICHQQGS